MVILPISDLFVSTIVLAFYVDLLFGRVLGVLIVVVGAVAAAAVGLQASFPEAQAWLRSLNNTAQCPYSFNVPENAPFAWEVQSAVLSAVTHGQFDPIKDLIMIKHR
eukprot:6298238-Amphidinium_carterae.1